MFSSFGCGDDIFFMDAICASRTHKPSLCVPHSLRNNTIGLKYEIKKGDGSIDEGDFESIELASVRQIAHEVLQSLKKGCPQYFE